VQVPKALATDEMEAAQSQTQIQCDWDHQLKPHISLMWTPLGDFSVICGNMSSGKLKSEHGKRNYPARQCHVCTVHKSQTRYICEFRIVSLHKGECFQRYRTLKHF
jgi:hypothetical protein